MQSAVQTLYFVSPSTVSFLHVKSYHMIARQFQFCETVRIADYADYADFRSVSVGSCAIDCGSF